MKNYILLATLFIISSCNAEASLKRVVDCTKTFARLTEVIVEIESHNKQPEKPSTISSEINKSVDLIKLKAEKAALEDRLAGCKKDGDEFTKEMLATAEKLARVQDEYLDKAKKKSEQYLGAFAQIWENLNGKK